MSKAVVEQNQQVRSRPSAPGELTQEQVRRSREDGFLIARGLLPAEVRRQGNGQSSAAAATPSG